MRTRIKVCCITSAQEASLAIALGADALGLVAAMPSGSNTISDLRILEIAARVPPPISTFLLTSEVTARSISAHVRATRPTTVQVVSHIDPKESAELAVLEPAIRRVQVLHVEGPNVLDLIPSYAPHVHAFLLDSGKPGESVPELGGTGRVHDWSVSAAFVKASPRPVFLAGGLNHSNVGEAIQTVRPFGLDLCSGVRTGGQLDPDKLTAFVEAVQTVDRETEAASSRAGTERIMPPAISPVRSLQDIAAITQLFRDYAAFLEIDLSAQGFAQELAGLPGPYAPPGGALLLARNGDVVLGCIALKPLSPGVAEIKRLYVKPQARGLKLGAALIDAITAEALRLGYREIKLDTVPKLEAAIALYRRAGFVPIAPYGSHPYPGLICLGKMLD